MKVNTSKSKAPNLHANTKPVGTGKKPGKPFKPSTRRTKPGTKPGKPRFKPGKDSLALSSEAKKQKGFQQPVSSVVDNFMNAWMDKDVARLKAEDAAKR